MIALKLTALGDGLGLVLPDEALKRLKIAEGDTLYLMETPEGYRLTPADPRHSEQIEAASEIMTRRRAALRELAK